MDPDTSGKPVPAANHAKKERSAVNPGLVIIGTSDPTKAPQETWRNVGEGPSGETCLSVAKICGDRSNVEEYVQALMNSDPACALEDENTHTDNQSSETHLESNQAASARGESSSNTSAVSNLSGNTSLTSDIDASSADDGSGDQEEPRPVSSQATNRISRKRKIDHKTPVWAKLILINIKEQHDLNQKWRERLEGLLVQDNDLQKKYIDAIIGLTSALNNMRS